MKQTLNNRRRYLTGDELEKLVKAGRKGRYGRRDATLILLMARHGLRVTEAVDLRWDQVDFTKGHLHVKRLKGGLDSVHPTQGDELRALRELRREQQPESAFVFTTERGGPMTRSNVAKLIDVAGKRAGLPHCHPHQLRHTCGHLLADAGHDTRRRLVRAVISSALPNVCFRGQSGHCHRAKRCPLSGVKRTLL
jgi:integrase